MGEEKIHHVVRCASAERFRRVGGDEECTRNGKRRHDATLAIGNESIQCRNER